MSSHVTYSDKNSLSNDKYKSNLSLNYEQVFSAIQPLKNICEVEAFGYLIELGSNENASQHLAQARKELSQLCTKSQWSIEFVNPDYTATKLNPKPDYTNQCGYLIFSNTQNDINGNLGKVIQSSKVIEKKIQRDFYAAQKLSQLDVESLINSITEPKNRNVIIDIDVLAIKTFDGDWIAILERYPFKAHEWVGISELIDKGYLN